MHIALNWLMQGVILGLAVAAGLRVIPRSRTQARYGFLCTAYVSLLVLPAVAPLLMLARDAARADVGPAVATPLVIVPAVWWTSATVTAGLWIVWFGMHAVALGCHMASAHDAKRCRTACPRDLLASLPHWSRISATGRPTRVVLSNSVRAAGVLGCGTPVIAIAPHLVEELSDTDLDRVLVHEWAHVQRRDDLAHLGQRLVRAVVGWHPAAWWIERQLAFERELACDEIAVRVTGSAKRYAECLVTIAALQGRPERGWPVLAAASRSKLHQRVERILAVPCAAVSRPWRALAITGAVGVVVSAFAAGSVHVATSAVASAVASTAPAASAPAASIEITSTGASLEPAVLVSSSVPSRNRQLRVRARAVAHETSASENAGTTSRNEDLSTTATASLPVTSVGTPPTATLFEVVASPSSEPVEHSSVAAPSLALQYSPADASAGWTRAADGGIAIGRASQAAGIATAGFFRRFGKKVAGSF